MKELLAGFNLSHVKLAYATDGILLVYDRGSFPLGFRKDNVDKILHVGRGELQNITFAVGTTVMLLKL